MKKKYFVILSLVIFLTIILLSGCQTNSSNSNLAGEAAANPEQCSVSCNDGTKCNIDDPSNTRTCSCACMGGEHPEAFCSCN